jgi:hypothetical protein
MNWACLFLFCAEDLARWAQRFPKVFCALYVISMAWMFSLQCEALKPNKTPFEQDVSGLALIMGIEDPEQFKWIYPDSAQLMTLSKMARAQGISIFSQDKARWIEQKYLTFESVDSGTKSRVAGKSCPFTVQEVKALAAAKGFVKILGAATGMQRRVSRFEVLDSNRQVLGFGVIDSSSDAREFAAYASQTILSQPITFLTDECEETFKDLPR